MAFQIDPNIPLQAGKVQFDPASILMQAQTNAANLEKHRFEMQKLREDYDAQKEARAQQKKMQMGIASDLAGIQSGTPAQYSQPSYAQTMPTGQMPQGMTGVLASERGQQMPQPQLFGENILQGNVDFNREMVSPAVAGREPSYIEMLKIGYKNAAMNQDIESAFKFGNMIKQAEIAEREQNAPVGNPYPTYDAKGNFVGTRVMTKAGQEVAFGTQGTTTVKPDVVSASDRFKEQKAAERQARDLAQKEREAFIKAQIEANKPDPVDKALTIVEGKEKIKAKHEQIKAYREKYANASDAIPLLDAYIAAAKQAPDTGFDSWVQTKLGYYGGGDKKQQDGMAMEKQAAESLLTFAVKQPGPSTDRDVESYRTQMGVIADPNASTSQKVAAAEQAKKHVLAIQKKYGAYLGDILSGKINPEDIAAKEVSNDPYAITKDTDPRRAKYLLNHKALVDAKDYEGAKLLTELYKKGAK